MDQIIIKKILTRLCNILKFSFSVILTRELICGRPATSVSVKRGKDKFIMLFGILLSLECPKYHKTNHTSVLKGSCGHIKRRLTMHDFRLTFVNLEKNHIMLKRKIIMCSIQNCIVNATKLLLF